MPCSRDAGLGSEYDAIDGYLAVDEVWGYDPGLTVEAEYWGSLKGNGDVDR